MSITVDSMVRVPSSFFSDEDKVTIKHSLRMTNPEYTSFVRFSRGWGKAPEQYLYSYWYEGSTMVLPRAWFMLNHADRLSKTSKIRTAEVSAAIPAPILEPQSHQREALEAVVNRVNLNDRHGLPTDTYVAMPPSSGKTIFGMMLAHCLGLRTLVVVPTKEIEEGWRRDLKKALGIEPHDIGTIRGKKLVIKDITLGSIQTLMDLDPSEWSDQFGLLLVDEVHRIPGVRFQSVVRHCTAHIRVGITATDYRKDGGFAVVKHHLGEASYKNEKYLNSVPLFYHSVCTPYGLSKKMSEKKTEEYTFNDLLESLETNHDRTRLIAALVKKITEEYPGGVLIVSHRTNHIDAISDALVNLGIVPAVITGTTKGRKQTFDEILAGKHRVTIATTKIMTEGASVPGWHHVVSTLPFSDTKSAIQLGGRPIRKDPASNKQEGHFWDIVDNNPMARNMTLKRYTALKTNMHRRETIDAMPVPREPNGFLFTKRSK